MCDSHGYVWLFNDAAVRLWGRRPLPGKELATALTGGHLDNEDFQIERPDHSRRLVRSYSRGIYSPLGTLVGSINTLVDITDLKDKETKSAWLSAIVRYSDDAIIGKTVDGIVTSWNLSAQRIFGYTAEEMTGQSILRLIPEDRQQEEPLILERLRRGERVDHFETKRRTKTGEILDISLSISPIKDARDQIIGVSKIARNITEQKRIERTYAEERERSRMAIAATRMGTWEYAVLEKTFHCSDEMLRIWGAPLSKATESTFFLNCVHPEDRKSITEGAKSAIHDRQLGYFDALFRILRYSDKDQRWIRAQGKVFFAQGLKPESFIGTVLDVTDAHQTQQTLERTVAERTKELSSLNRRLQESNHELEQFAYIASHDLQEPLRKIQIFSELVEERLKPSLQGEVLGYFGRIKDAADRMSRLIRDVLEYSRLTNMEAELETVDLNEVFLDVCAELDWQIAEKNAVVRAGDLPSVKGIRTQFCQVFRNMIGNSVKFCTGTPRISITSDRIPAEKVPAELSMKRAPGYIRLRFSDNGIGFEQEYASKMFKIFQRLNRQEAYSGSGIGLAICKKIVDNHEGAIEAEGRPGEGATFTIYLPDEAG